MMSNEIKYAYIYFVAGKYHGVPRYFIVNQGRIFGDYKPHVKKMLWRNLQNIIKKYKIT